MKNDFKSEYIKDWERPKNCCDCAHYQECFFADTVNGICNSYKDAPQEVNAFWELICVPFNVI